MTLLLKSFSLKFGPFERLACLLRGLQRPCQPHDERWGFGNWRRLPLARRGITFFSLGLITGNWKTSGNSVVADVWLVGRFEFWNTPTQPKESRGTERSRKRKFLWLPLGKMLKTLRIKNSQKKKKKIHGAPAGHRLSGHPEESIWEIIFGKTAFLALVYGE